MRSLIRPASPCLVPQSEKSSWSELPLVLKLAILELSDSAVDLINFAAASKECSNLIRKDSLWTKCSGLRSQSDWISSYGALSAETQEYIYANNGPTLEREMNDLEEALSAARSAVMQFEGSGGRFDDTIRQTMNEAVKHARRARIDLDSLSPEFLGLARSYSGRFQAVDLAEGGRCPLYRAMEYLTKPQEDANLLKALETAHICVMSGLREEMHYRSPSRIGALSSLTPGAAYLIAEGLNEDSAFSHAALQTALQKCADEAYFLHYSGKGDDNRKYLQEAYLYSTLLNDPPARLPEKLRQIVPKWWTKCEELMI